MVHRVFPIGYCTVDDLALPSYLANRTVLRAIWNGIPHDPHVHAHVAQDVLQSYRAMIDMRREEDRLVWDVIMRPARHNRSIRAMSPNSYREFCRNHGLVEYAAGPALLSSLEHHVDQFCPASDRKRRTHDPMNPRWESLAHDGFPDWSVRARLSAMPAPTPERLLKLLNALSFYPPVFHSGTLTIDYHR